MKITVNTPCFVCGSTSSELFFEKEYPLFNYPGKFIIRKCSKCGLLFNSPRLSNEELANLYNTNYYFFQRQDSDEFRRITNIYMRTISLIKNEIMKRKIAEIGSAKGYLLALLKRLGWEVQGIEISSDASKYAISKFNVPTFTGTIEDYSNSNEKDVFPVVLAIDVIEHVPSPIDFLNSVDKIVSSNGILIIDTPNADSRNIEVLSSEWEGFNPFHIYVFSSQILQSLLVDMGYSIERCFSYGNQEKKMETGSEELNDKFNVIDFFKSTLRSLGIFELSKIIYRKLISLFNQHEKDVDSLISDAVSDIEKKLNYLYSDDAKGCLAKENKGDNIVIIAKKKSAI